MGSLESLRRYTHLRKDGKLPWPFGYNAVGSASNAPLAWAVLTLEEKLAISRHNPFKRERNEALIGLHERGLTQEILRDLSGLHLHTIERITKKKRSKRRYEGGIEIS